MAKLSNEIRTFMVMLKCLRFAYLLKELIYLYLRIFGTFFFAKFIANIKRSF